MKEIGSKIINCPVLDVCHLLGKKWTCPLLINFKQDNCYCFEEIIRLSSRQINRTLLSNHLKEMKKFGLVTYKNNCYCLTDKGIKVRDILIDLREIILNDYSEGEIIKFKDICLVNSFRSD